MWFRTKNVPKKTLLTGPNLNLYTSSGSAVIKKIVEGGGADSLYARRVNKVKDALPLNSDFFPSPTLCFRILEEIVNPLMPGGNERSWILTQTCS